MASMNGNETNGRPTETQVIERACKHSTTMIELTRKPRNWGSEPKAPLTIQELACAMYEGMPWVQNLAEQCARAYGQAGALTFFDMMGDDVQNFWRGIAKQIIDHSRHWKANEGSACVLDDEETARLRDLPRVPETEL